MVRARPVGVHSPDGDPPFVQLSQNSPRRHGDTEKIREMSAPRKRLPHHDYVVNTTFRREAMQVRPIEPSGENSELLGFLRVSVPPW